MGSRHMDKYRIFGQKQTPTTYAMTKKKPFLGFLSLSLSLMSLVISYEPFSMHPLVHVHGTSTASVASACLESASEGSTAGSSEASLPEENL